MNIVNTSEKGFFVNMIPNTIDEDIVTVYARNPDDRSWSCISRCVASPDSTGKEYPIKEMFEELERQHGKIE